MVVKLNRIQALQVGKTQRGTAAFFLLLQMLLKQLQLKVTLCKIVVKGLARKGKANCFFAALKEDGSQLLLQQADLLADCRLGDKKNAGCFCETFLLCDSQKVLYLQAVHTGFSFASGIISEFCIHFIKGLCEKQSKHNQMVIEMKKSKKAGQKK